MPPKVNNAAKGQTSLFSFFQQKPVAATSDKVAADSSHVTSGKEFHLSKTDAFQASGKNSEKSKNLPKGRKTVISDDEDEDYLNNANINKNAKLPKKQKESVPADDASVSDAAFDEDDEEEEEVVSSGEEYSNSGSDAAEEDSEEDDDEDEDEALEDTESEEEDDDVKRSRKRQRLQKGVKRASSTVASLPRKRAVSASGSTSRSSKKPRKPTVTPDPRAIASATTTPRRSLIFFDGGAGGANKNSRTSSVITPGTNSTARSTTSTAGPTTPWMHATLLPNGTTTPQQQNGSGEDSLAQIDLPEGVVGRGSHEHNSFQFLLPQHRKDGKGRRPDAPDFNPRTLHVSSEFLKQQTPAMAQWWQFKSANMDTVLFFKVGKFYELFHMDADIGFAELNLIYMKGTKAHSGFPEVSYGKFASILVSKGYRVARVEQTETPEMLKERNGRLPSGKKDKVVLREMCSMMSKGTRTYCHLDDLSLLASATSDTANSTLGGAAQADDSLASSVLLCIKEMCSAEIDTITAVADVDVDDSSAEKATSAAIAAVEYGVCCIDTVLGSVTLAQFQDNEQRSRLRTLLARYRPTEVLLEHGGHSEHTVGSLRLLVPHAAVEYLRREEELPNASTTVALLRKGQYYNQSSSKFHLSSSNSTVQHQSGSQSNTEEYCEQWPAVMRAVVAGLHDGSSELVLSAIGGALWQLRRCLIDFEVLSLGKVFAYIPPDLTEAPPSVKPDPEVPCAAGTSSKVLLFSGADQEHHDMTFPMSGVDSGLTTATAADAAAAQLNTPKNMTLDEVALSNLEILVNNHDRTTKGSLWEFVNKCKTPFGRRLLRSWLCHPLYRVSDISRRQEAVAELLAPASGLNGGAGGGLADHVDRMRALSKNIPDLERLLTRVHSNGLRRATAGANAHPDSRAILYENYNVRKIKDFADLLSGMESVLKIVNLFKDASVTSKLLLIAVKPVSEGGKFPRDEVAQLLQHFREIFDEKQAKRDGDIRPRPGVDTDYDEARAEIGLIESEFESYLRELKSTVGIHDLKYFGSGKDRYQIEVPMAQSHTVPHNWTSKSQKKTHRRYWTTTIEIKLAKLVAAEERLHEAQRDTMRRIFQRFDENAPVWITAVSCIALLDALQSLSLVSSMPNYCRPNVHEPRIHSSSVSSDNGAAVDAVDAVDANFSVPELDIRSGRHPMLEFSLAQRGSGDCIPNDVLLGGTALHPAPTLDDGTQQLAYHPRMILLSGPNMGGKSTLLRQTCLITILAQIGCWVPADSVDMTPVDRIFTRVGASDRILAGQSTFYVELAETALILNAATPHSLCILDELGRGTATFDGTAIAHSVVEHLVSVKRCRAIFATHYHSLVDDWSADARVRLGHMQCVVHCPPSSSSDVEDGSINNNDVSTSEVTGSNRVSAAAAAVEEVTFLYKLSDGSSPRSYGINVARLAGLPTAVISLALKQSREFEERMKTMKNVTHNPISAAEEKIVTLFERLVSIAATVCSVEELVFLAKEMWRRVDAMATGSDILG